MVIVKVGTSGYSYFWNPDKKNPFKWYVSKGFKTVEINASFYSFPRRSWVKAWTTHSPREFDFSIKVHRSITHMSRLGPRSIDLWIKFRELFKPLEKKIVFWLFQFPEYFKPTHENIFRIKSFLREAESIGSIVMEFRDPGWWKNRRYVEEAGAVFCSIDAPELPNDIISSNNIVYLRLHGRTEWYAYEYSYEELIDLAEKIRRIDAEKKYIYFNNDHGMLENALTMKNLLEEKS